MAPLPRALPLAGMCMVLGDGFLCGGFSTDGYAIVFFLCVGNRFLWMLLCAVGAHAINGDAGLASYDMMSNVRWGSSGFDYQLDEKPGWVLVPTFFGGAAPLRGSSSSFGELRALVLVASDSSVSDDVMVDGHLFQPGRSAVTKHVGINVLHKTATKNCDSSPERRLASSNVLWPPAARQTRSCLQELSCNFLFFQGCSCKIWAITTKTFM
ncbi:hypothetical protein SORBI_3005G184000 [Sorghum bicolor]|uniref:Uncharacterized protein n=1 Tax=Sorghum bicolor TaxID=4558 RepID=A0A1Z5RJI8_SORBI|nr:hypothetical protein SORBI_3005G184000 [Sorghum bicolor]